MSILHTRKRIGLALMLAGALALPVATPADAAPQNRPGNYLEKGDQGKNKNKQQKQRAERQKARQGKVKAQQQANRAQNRAQRAERQANRAKQQERQVRQQAQHQRQQARQAQRHARQAQAHAAQQRAQAQAARQQRAHARAVREQAQARAAHRQAQAWQAQQRAHRQAVRHQAAIQHQRHQRRHPHYVNARPRPQGRSNVFAVDGYLQDDGYQCVQLRDDQGNPYILEGRVEGLYAGDHVRLVAREAPFSSCGGYGRPVIVTRVVRVWADPHHRSAFFAANVDGSFDNYARWRRGDDWLRDAEYYDPYNDGYEDDYYYDEYGGY